MEQKDFFIETFYKEDGEVAPFGFTLGSPWFAAMKETTKPMIRRDAFIALGDGQRPKADGGQGGVGPHEPPSRRDTLAWRRRVLCHRRHIGRSRFALTCPKNRFKALSRRFVASDAFPPNPTIGARRRAVCARRPVSGAERGGKVDGDFLSLMFPLCAQVLANQINYYIFSAFSRRAQGKGGGRRL